MNQRYVASGSRLALAISVLGFACATASAQEATPPTSSAEGEQPNAIVVSGVRQSIETAIDDKRRASEIKDSITAEDIGQLVQALSGDGPLPALWTRAAHDWVRSRLQGDDQSDG